MLEDKDEGRELPRRHRRRLRGGACVRGDHGIAACVHDGSRAQLEGPLPDGDPQRLDPALARRRPHEVGVEIEVEARGRGGELVGQAREGERGVGQDPGPSAPHGGPAARHGRQPAGEIFADARVEGLRGPGRRGLVEPADRAHHAGGRHAAEKAVALDEGRARARAGGRHRGGQPRGPAAHHDDVVGHGTLVHSIPSRTTSTICATSASVTAPSTHEVTRLFVPAHRLKNTPIPGRGRTAGAW